MRQAAIPLATAVLWYISPSAGAQVLNVATAGEFEPVPLVNTADPAVEGALEVIVDVPSVLHATRYQRGALGEWGYVLYPDGSAKVLSPPSPQVSLFEMTCRRAVSCEILSNTGVHFTVEATRAPKPQVPQAQTAESLARYLAQWVLAGTGPVPVAPVEPVPQELNLPRPSASHQDASPDFQRASDNAENVSIPAENTLEASDVEDPLKAAASEDEKPEIAIDAAAETEARAEDQILNAQVDLDAACPEVAAFEPDECHQSAVPLVIPKPTPLPQTTSTEARSKTQATLSPTSTALEPVVSENSELDNESYLKRIGLACSITGTTSLQGPSKSGLQFSKPKASLGCSAKLSSRLSLRFSVIGYGNSSEKQSFDPDFTYAFNYRINDKITLGYSNYSAQFNGDNGDFLDAFKDGTLRASYKLPSIPLPNASVVPCTASIGLPNILSESLNLSCGYALTQKLRIGGTLNLYAPGEQGDFDPDYSYTASYRVSDDWLISYSNYSNNRWPWNRNGEESSGFFAGSLSVNYKLTF